MKTIIIKSIPLSHIERNEEDWKDNRIAQQSFLIGECQNIIISSG